MPARYDALERAAEGTGRRARRRRQPPVLPRDAARRLRDDRCSSLGAARLAQRRTEGAGRASSSRSRSAATSRRRATLDQAHRPGVPRAPDLPHRPLPRQRDRPEHPGVPLRQRHLRADLEPPLRRPRADHRRARPSASKGAAATTRSRARCATWCRTTCCRCSRSSRWSRRVVQRRRRPRREGEGVPRDHADRGYRSRHRARAVRRRARSSARRCPAIARKRASRRTPNTETYAALKLDDRELALGGRAVLPARRQAAPEARDGSRDHIQDAAAPALPPDGAATIRRRTSSSCASSRTRASRFASARRCPARAADVRPVNMDFRYGTSFGVDPPEAYERLLLDAMHRRLDAVHALGQRRSCVGAADAGARRLGGRRVAARVLRSGQLGTGRRARASSNGTDVNGTGCSADSNGSTTADAV